MPPPPANEPSLSGLLLRRLRQVVVPATRDGRAPAGIELARAAAVEWSALGCVPSQRLLARLAALDRDTLGEVTREVAQALRAESGADQPWVPLFRKFPHGVPEDTFALWLQRVVAHYVLEPDQPCLFCEGEGRTHVLSCGDVVCDACFDGANYSACPICQHVVDRSSPFFAPSSLREPPAEAVRFERLEVAEDADGRVRELLGRLCARTQALSPVDRQDLATLVLAGPDDVLDAVPEEIPVAEVMAQVWGAAAQRFGTAVLPRVAPHLRTATHVLRWVAACSGADPALQGERISLPITMQPIGVDRRGRPWPPVTVERSHTVKRFRMARLPRAVRRFVLASLEALPPAALFEDVLRHRSYWVWVGEFVHPHEYAARYPNAARAFWIARRKAPVGRTGDGRVAEGTSPQERAAPRVETFASRLEAAADAGDGAAMTALLGERPGELARRFDHLLRVCGDDEAAAARAVERFVGLVPHMATPVLATLETLLPFRARGAPRGLSRVFWPKGAVTTGHYADETRAPLASRTIAPAVEAIRRELLARFAAWPRRRQWIVDRALADVPVPFNERTASVAAADLPRGSRVRVSSERWARLFLHWCQPAAGHATDLDLSVLFYDGAWGYLGVCSYYQLTCEIGGTVIARSAGDLQSAPPPDGACEFVDVDREAALGCGVRYAVALVNSYRGMPFRALERAFAGLMLRADPEGQHFDPRSVRLRFQLDGDNGGFLPMVLDLEQGALHWLDVYVRGQLAWNNAASSRPGVERVCPTLMAWFASGQRPSMLDLALFHAAARGDEVVFRGADLRRVSTAIGIDGLRAAALDPDAGERVGAVGAEDPEGRALALVHGDLLDGDLLEGEGRPVSAAESFCVFAQHQAGGLRAADWLSRG